MSAVAQFKAAPLTDKQERFVLEYLLDQNASAAARRAGYAWASAGAQAAELMRHPLVRRRIREELEELFSQLRLTAYRILRQRTLAAFFDPRRLFDTEGKILPLKDLDPEVMAVLTINYDRKPNGDVTTKVRAPNCHQALSALEKRYAQFTDLSRWDPLPDQVGAGPDEEAELAMQAQAMQAQAERAAQQPAAPELVPEPEPVPEPVLAAAPAPAPTLTQRTVGVVTRLMAGKTVPLAVGPEPIGAVTALLTGRGSGRDGAAARKSALV